MFDGDFEIRLVIKHPTLSLAEVTAQLRMQPQHGHSAGEPRKTLKGRPLDGVWPETFWGHTMHFNHRRDFFSASVECLKSLESHAEFFRSIRKEKGMVAIYVHLNGCHNFGDVITLEGLSLFTSLGVEFGIEVFP